MEERKELEKVKIDYFRWVLRIDFCTPRYLVRRELGLEKLKVRGGLRTRKYEEKIRDMKENRWVKVCWREKQELGWIDLYGKERKKYYNRNGWGIAAVDSMCSEERDMLKELENREGDVQRQKYDRRIREAKFNREYKDLMERDRRANIWTRDVSVEREEGEDIMALVKLRLGNWRRITNIG